MIDCHSTRGEASRQDAQMRIGGSKAWGQLNGLAAGANVLTAKFTPEAEQSKNVIYGKDRYVVRNDHVSNIVALAGIGEGSFGVCVRWLEGTGTYKVARSASGARGDCP
jgi:hypothetical protein